MPRLDKSATAIHGLTDYFLTKSSLFKGTPSLKLLCQLYAPTMSETKELTYADVSSHSGKKVRGLESEAEKFGRI